MQTLKTYITTMLLFSVLNVSAMTLERRAAWEAKFEPFSATQPGRVIKELEPESPLYQAGIRPHDRLIAVNGQIITSAPQWYDITDALVAGKVHDLLFKRHQESKQVKVQFNPIPQETHPNLDTLYEVVVSDYAIAQRVIVTKPKDKTKAMPAMVVLQGLSCSSIEQTPNRQSAFVRLLTDLIEQSGRVVMRIEKPGMGDSQGDCSQTDFHTELNGYESAIKWFKQQPYVDPDDIIVYGNSMGSALAPYMANKFDLAGVISDGTYLRSWFEHMLDIERRILSFKGHNQTEITEKMTDQYIPLYYGMLVLKQSYQDVINQFPSLQAANYHDPEHMYGRPMAFYHQLQDFDVAGNWQRLKVPARIRWGVNDWIMSEADNDMIIDILKQAGHDDHKLYKQPGLDHWQAIHESAANSFNGTGGQWDESISQVILDWIEEISAD